MIDENIVHEIDEIEKHLKLLKEYLSDDYKFSHDTLNCFENTPKELNDDESDQTSFEDFYKHVEFILLIAKSYHNTHSIAERLIHYYIGGKVKDTSDDVVKMTIYDILSKMS